MSYYEAHKKGVGQVIRARREAMGLRQQDLADKLGIHLQSVSRIENGLVEINKKRLEQIAEVFGTKLHVLMREGDPDWHAIVEAEKTGAAPVFMDNPPPIARVSEFNRNAAYKHRLRPAVYERVYGYIDKLRSAGATDEQLDEAERLMADSAYNKLNARDPKERTEEDMLLDVDDAWDYIREVLTRGGLKGL